jgi:hypothetical protein
MVTLMVMQGTAMGTAMRGTVMFTVMQGTAMFTAMRDMVMPIVILAMETPTATSVILEEDHTRTGAVLESMVIVVVSAFTGTVRQLVFMEIAQQLRHMPIVQTQEYMVMFPRNRFTETHRKSDMVMFMLTRITRSDKWELN